MKSNDELGELIVAKGLAANLWQLDNNHAIDVPDDFELPAPWSLPSRMFQFPLETHGPTKGRPRQLGLHHPLLADHPFVQHVESLLGITLAGEHVSNECGYSSSDLARWWHAVDLISAGRWRDLLDTLRFTTSEDVLGAVVFGLGLPTKKGMCLNVGDARTILAHLGSDEPGDRMRTIREHLMAPSPCKSDKGGVSWPVNCASRKDENSAWAYIFAIEDGWFQCHKRLGWSVSGRARYAGKVAVEWGDLTRDALEGLGGTATVDDLCRMIEGHDSTEAPAWRAKVRESLPRVALAVGRGEWTVRRYGAAA